MKMNNHKEQAMEILAKEAVCHQRTDTCVYSVRVNNKFLCDEDTYQLRLKIEAALRECYSNRATHTREWDTK